MFLQPVGSVKMPAFCFTNAEHALCSQRGRSRLSVVRVQNNTISDNTQINSVSRTCDCKPPSAPACVHAAFSVCVHVVTQSGSLPLGEVGVPCFTPCAHTLPFLVPDTRSLKPAWGTERLLLKSPSVEVI